MHLIFKLLYHLSGIYEVREIFFLSRIISSIIIFRSISYDSRTLKMLQEHSGLVKEY